MTFKMACHAVKANTFLFSEYWISLDPYNVRTFTSVTRDSLLLVGFMTSCR